MCKGLEHTPLIVELKFRLRKKERNCTSRYISAKALRNSNLHSSTLFLVSMPLIKSAISLSTSFSRRHMRTETSIQKRTLSKHKGSSVLLFMFIVYHDLLLLQLLVEHFCIRQHDFESSNTILTLNSIFVSCHKKFVAHCS